MKLLETLQAGLATRRAAGMLEDGQLVVAEDAAYDPDDIGVRVAAGREACGQDPISAYPPLPIGACVGISWPPNTEFYPGVQQRRQIVYYRNAAGLPLFSVPAKDESGSAEMDVETPHELPDNHAQGMPTDGIEAVGFDGNFFILGPTGGNIWLKRHEETPDLNPLLQRSYAHGVDLMNLDVQVIKRPGLGPSNTVPAGYYAYWITWYDENSEQEGTRLAPEVGANIDANNAINWMRLGGSQSNFEAQVSVEMNAFNAARPWNATHVRIYRSKAYDDTLARTTSDPPASIPWPQAWRIAEVQISSLLTIQVNGATGQETHWLLYEDEFAITNDLIERTDDAPIFEAVVVNEVPDGRDGPPPVSTTGDTFEESLCLDDIADRQVVRFSYPNRPHSFPATFFIRIRTKDGDGIVSIKTLGTRLFVGMEESVWKINWLPRESETDFSRGRLGDIVTRKGVAGKRATALLTLPGWGPVIAWVSRDGIYATDLDNTEKLTKDINWQKLIINPTNALLANDVDGERLVMAYDSGAGFRDKLLLIHYSGGRIRITGPINRDGRVYALPEVVTETGRRVIVSTDRNGLRLYYEGRGVTDASTGTPMSMRVVTRDIYPYALGDHATYGRILAHADGPGQVSIAAHAQGKHTSFARILTEIMGEEPLVSKQAKSMGERVHFEISATNSVRVNAVGVYHDPLGEVER